MFLICYSLRFTQELLVRCTIENPSLVMKIIVTALLILVADGHEVDNIYPYNFP